MEKIRRAAVVPLRILLVLLFAVSVMAQVAMLVAVMPDIGHEAGQPPELTYFRWTVLVVAVLGLVGVEVVLVCTWQLLTLVKDDRIFSAHSLPWVDGIVWAIFAGCMVLLAACVPVAAFAQVDDAPGLMALPLLMLVVGVALGLLMVVMRALLLQATTLRADMEAVI